MLKTYKKTAVFLTDMAGKPIIDIQLFEHYRHPLLRRWVTVSCVNVDIYRSIMFDGSIK